MCDYGQSYVEDLLEVEKQRTAELQAENLKLKAKVSQLEHVVGLLDPYVNEEPERHEGYD